VPEVRRFGVILSIRAGAKNVACTLPLHAKINNVCKCVLPFKTEMKNFGIMPIFSAKGKKVCSFTFFYF
jgi:hypothetical protein